MSDKWHSSGLVLGPALFNISASDTGSGIKGTLSKSSDNIKLCGAVDVLEGGDAIQRDLNRLKRRTGGDDFKLKESGFRLDIRKKFFTMKVMANERAKGLHADISSTFTETTATCFEENVIGEKERKIVFGIWGFFMLLARKGHYMEKLLVPAEKIAAVYSYPLQLEQPTAAQLHTFIAFAKKCCLLICMPEFSHPPPMADQASVPYIERVSEQI
ncbi:hypothetical protein BTVI_09495 [Pitangus sulphuratus]|nr:hypothetical protein BTVI_09495 [Pitangus sulphuratus]